ncbi:MAG: hypothetical protein ABWY27_03095 [Telluria sp.]
MLPQDRRHDLFHYFSGNMGVQLLTESFMKLAVVLVGALAISLGASAAPRSEIDIKRGVAEVAERYANAVSCGGVTIKPEDVLTLSAYQDDGGLALSKYAVLWHGDLGCMGGSGSEMTRLAITTINTGHYVVQPELSSPVAAFESPVRFVSRVVSSGADTLVLEGMEYAPNDPRSTPSKAVRFTLRMDPKGGWRLVDKIGIAAVTP